MLIEFLSILFPLKIFYLKSGCNVGPLVLLHALSQLLLVIIVHIV